MATSLIVLVGLYFYGYIEHRSSARRWKEEDKKDHASLLRMRRAFKRTTNKRDV